LWEAAHGDTLPPGCDAGHTGQRHRTFEGASRVSRVNTFRAVIAAMTTVAAAAVTVPAAGAVDGHQKPSAKQMFAKTAAGSRAATHAAKEAADEGDGGEPGDENEAEMVRLRGEFLQSITAAPAQSAPPAGLLAAQRAATSLPVAGGRWDEVTDKPFLNDPVGRGFNYGEGNGLVTGRMTGLTVSGGFVYAGAASGGVWRSSDAGRHWRPVNAGLPRLAVGTVATDPRDGSVWVGTGEANNAAENQYGVGTYRLARGSSRWTKIGGSELYGSGAYRIRWIGDYAYIATSHGLYRRPADAPASAHWRPVLQPAGDVKYPPSSSVTDFLPVPGSHGDRILAVVGWAGYTTPAGTKHNGFYVGTGSRGSFQRITPTGDINPATIGRTTFSSSQGWLYAVVQDTSTDSLLGQGAYVSRSGPAGPWRRIADVNKLAASDSAMTNDPATGFFPGVQVDYNQNIVADPRDPKHVYLQLEEVYESTDGGKSWDTVGPYWNLQISCNPTNIPRYTCPFTTHPDQHAGMIYNGDFWAGNDGGLWRRPTSWHQRGHWTDLNATLYTTQNYSIGVGKVPGGLAYWGGLQDNGESYTRTDLRRVEQAFTGDGTDTIVDASNGDRAVEGYVFMDWYLTTHAAKAHGPEADLREISPSCLTATNPPAECDPNPRFVAPLEKDVNNPDHWVTGGQYVWDDTKSWHTVCNGTDGCDWKKVYDTGDGHQATALAANGDTTYAAWCGLCNPVGFERGLATNYGGTWHELSLAGVPQRYITSISVARDDPAHVFISIGSYSQRWIPDAGYGHVYESRDGGASWTDVSGNLPDAPVYRVTQVGHQLVAGTEVGAFVARTGAGSHPLSWSQLGSGLPNVTVWDLTSAAHGLVVAGTHGRGDWQVKLGR